MALEIKSIESDTHRQNSYPPFAKKDPWSRPCFALFFPSSDFRKRSVSDFLHVHDLFTF